jgi:hypothetical protein
MRLSTDDGRDGELGLETIAAAAEAGMTVFDTARAYGRGAAETGALDALADSAARLSAAVTGSVESALCPHGAGPPRCWCRPPLPGLPLAFARAHGVDPSRSILVGTGPAHRTLAATLGARYVPV